MVSIPALILPIVVATALVWVAAALVWTVLPWHKRTFRALPDEAGALSALRAQPLAPGQYDFPHITSPRDMQEPQLRRQLETGPAGFITVRPPGVPAMGKAMALSGIFYLLVSIAVAYLASRTLAAGADYMAVFRITGTAAWMAYGAAAIPEAIWFGRPWSGIAKTLLDAFIYAMLTGGAFSGLWPEG